MSLPIPNLDDRKFQDFVDEAKRRIPRYAPMWTDHNVSDPGITLIELFAWMTEQYIYRLNQTPRKNLLTFLNLIGVKLAPARPAKGDVTFTLAAAPTPARRFIIPRATQVATERTETDEAIIMSTDEEMEVFPPALRWLLTSQDGDEFQDMTAALHDPIPFSVWGNPPAPAHAFYVGFDQDLSAHLLTLALNCEKMGIGIDPVRPPWRWEVWLGSERQWQPLEVVSDTTGGLNQNGEVRLSLPYRCQPYRLLLREARTWVRCAPLDQLAPGETPYARSPRISYLAAYTIGITIPVTHAQTVGPEVLGISNGQSAQHFKFQNANVLDLEGPEEAVQISTTDGAWETWQRVDDFGDSKPGDRHYVFDPITGVVEFGPAIRQRDGSEPQFGAIPPQGATIRISRYRVGGGIRGNVAEGRIKILKTTVPSVASVRNRAPITGGIDAQSLDDALLRGPALLRTRHRAVTAEDFEYLAREVEGVGRVRCLQPRPDDSLAPKPGTVQLLVIPGMPPLEGDELQRHIDRHEAIAQEDQRAAIEAELQARLELPEATRLRLIDYLDARRLLTTRIEIGKPQYVWVTVQTRIKSQLRAEPERVRRDVKIALYRFLHPLYGGSDGTGWVFGQPLTLDKVYSLIQRVPGVEYATELNLYPIDMADANGQRLQGSSQVIPVPPNGVVMSYYHNVYLAK
ncbi:MAG: putative baseplate assembly protein [Anaerolineae bacterium]